MFSPINVSGLVGPALCTVSVPIGISGFLSRAQTAGAVTFTLMTIYLEIAHNPIILILAKIAFRRYFPNQITVG